MIKRIILALVAIALLGYIAFRCGGSSQPTKRVFRPEVSYSIRSYKPYDIKYFYEILSKASPKGLVINDEKPDDINSNLKGENGVMVICSPYFLPDKSESDKLLRFVNSGNDLYISAFSFSPTFIDTLINLQEEPVFYNQWPPIPNAEDSTEIIWPLPNQEPKMFVYPGKGFAFYNQGYFEEADTLEVLNKNKNEDWGLVRIPFGSGKIYIQMQPITMSNYFLLHKNNFEYLHLLFEEMGVKKKKVIWDDFYRRHRVERSEGGIGRNQEPGRSYFWELVNQNPPLAWAVYTFLGGLILFLLIHSRRIQRPVAVIPDVKNTSYDFTQALAGLYWLRQDHRKISEKLVSHLYDYLQTKYRIFPKDLVEGNLNKLSQKTGKSEEEISNILKQLAFLSTNKQIDKSVLVRIYQDVFNFIKN